MSETLEICIYKVHFNFRSLKKKMMGIGLRPCQIPLGCQKTNEPFLVVSALI